MKQVLVRIMDTITCTVNGKTENQGPWSGAFRKFRLERYENAVALIHWDVCDRSAL